MDKKQIIGQFSCPSTDYRGKPFWSWNGELREDELVRQAKVMKEMGLGGFFMHSRSGLITEYLGDEWFDLINAVADCAEEIGVEAWLYDEDRWPSGSAGGKVTVDHQYRMKSIYCYEMLPEKFDPAEDIYALFIAKIDGINMYGYKQIEKDDDISAVIAEEEKKAVDKPGVWKVLRFAIVPDPCHSNYNGTTYIDTMSYKAVRRFIEMTHEEYKKRCGDRLGRSIKGIFTDEPHRGHAMDKLEEKDGVIACPMCWTDDFFEEFEKRYGYDALAVIPELFYRPDGEIVARVKLHYFDLANKLFIERFAKQINDWCKENNIIFTGHVLHEDSLSNQSVPNGSLMRFYEEMGYPGIDVLTEHNRCYWVAKQLQSAARQLDRKWLLSELYGCTGWQFNFKSHKAVGDWQALFGINLRCQHLSWYTMEGESKRDYPASILHQSPWYPYYDKVESYFGRFGLVMSEGKPACDVLLMNPIESVWCQAYRGWAQWITSISPEVTPYEKRYEEMFHMLTDNQIDFDYGEEDMMARHYSLSRDKNGKAVLNIGKASYHVVIVGNMLTIRPSTIEILREFEEMGGKVILAGDAPTYCDAVRIEGEFALSDKAIKVPYDEKAIIDAVRACSYEYVSITDSEGNTHRDIFVQVRRDFGDGGEAFVILNIDRDNPKTDVKVKIKTDKQYHLEKWDMETGLRSNADDLATYAGGVMIISTALEAAGTECFVLVENVDATLPAEKKYTTLDKVVIDGSFDYEREEQNVCVLDWVKWRWNGGEWSDKLEVLKADQKVRDSLGLERRGGEMLQPWYSKLNDKKQYGELELEYEFVIKDMPEGKVVLAGERPDYNDYYINGVKLENRDVHDFWIDDCFKKMDIPEGALKVGKNIVTVKTTFMRTTNIEALYLVGDFGVVAYTKGATVTTLPEKIGCENYEKYNMPFYGGNLTYKLTPEMYADKIKLSGDEKVFLSPVSFTGGCVKVSAEGIKDSIIAWEPYEADVTAAVKAGKTINVTVAGVRKNTFGPLHELPKIAWACGPGNFVTGTPGRDWTDEYNLIDSGLTGIVLEIKK